MRLKFTLVIDLEGMQGVRVGLEEGRCHPVRLQVLAGPQAIRATLLYQVGENESAGRRDSRESGDSVSSRPHPRSQRPDWELHFSPDLLGFAFRAL